MSCYQLRDNFVSLCPCLHGKHDEKKAPVGRVIVETTKQRQQQISNTRRHYYNIITRHTCIFR